ncbi:Uncharacterised protein [Mycoplasma putrefaciens]|uniref:Uncharacterized protein n=1 Tax=Mycoplasma putrefaciens (strain ATCC 15718 / NCTC 10155 / C30 KS-1 / KS-1) TaxID=743965 RepID=A0A7U3ZT38_MYCPK|nr:hypothetical protein [Mycoplasma putrefaciens]AEM69041.1 hypothetical protein MPUT_0707 [Mycoplasma putrefaciens KS1]SYV96644.1 Uncharacterised protein [Mycoplasma putrefaciens]
MLLNSENYKFFDSPIERKKILRNGVIEYDNIYLVLIDENTKGVRLESESILEFVSGSDKKLNFRLELLINLIKQNF